VCYVGQEKPEEDLILHRKGVYQTSSTEGWLGETAGEKKPCGRGKGLYRKEHANKDPEMENPQSQERCLAGSKTCVISGSCWLERRECTCGWVLPHRDTFCAKAVGGVHHV